MRLIGLALGRLGDIVLTPCGLALGFLLLLLDLGSGFSLFLFELCALLLLDLELGSRLLARFDHHLLGERRLHDLVGVLVLETGVAGTLAFHLV